MKILLVTEYYPPHIGGVEVVFSALAHGLAKRGHECCVVTCRVAGTRKYEEIEGIRVHRVWVPNKADRYWFAFLAIPTVLKLARRADLVHTTTFTAAVPAWLVSKLLRKKRVITVHEVWGELWGCLSNMNRFSAILHRLAEGMILSLSFDRHVCISQSTRARLKARGISDEKLAVVYNGIDQELFDGSRVDASTVRKELGLSNKFVLLYYGRPGVSKGLPYVIQAMPLLLARIPLAHLLLILGKRPAKEYRQAIEMAGPLNSSGCVTLLEPVPREELPNYIAAADCVVVPSISEGFGFSAAEACAMGRPVVASNAASLPEVVSGEYVLVEPRSAEALAHGVEMVFRKEAMRSERRIFRWEDCVQQYEQLYLELP